MDDVQFLEDSQRAMLNVLEDVFDERKKLDELTTRFELATVSAHVAVWEWNVANDSLEANEEFYRLYQATPKDFIHARSAWFGYIHPDDQLKAKEELEKALNNRSGFELLVRVVMPDESIKYIKTISRFKDDKNSLCLVGVQMDVTKETDVSRLKSEFISLASHQLRTPLTTISWYTELLLADKSKAKFTSEQKEFLQEIFLGSKRMIKLVNSLLNISRIEAGTYMVNPEMVDVAELVGKVVEEQRPKIVEKKLTVNVQKGTLPKILLDVSLTTIILQNLITNAVKYTPDKGKVKIVLSINKKDQQLMIEVADTGVGISEKDKQHIFSRMFRTDQARKMDNEGSGLGLHLARELIEKNGGKIWFESKEGKGTTFFVNFPLSGMTKKTGSKSVIL